MPSTHVVTLGLTPGLASGTRRARPCRWRRAALLLSLTLVLPAGAAADTPETIAFQGFLQEGDAPYTGSAVLHFALYADSLGGSPLWSQLAGNVTVTRGLYTAFLGPFDDLAFDRLYWLEVSLNGTALAPRYRLHSAPYALHAERAALATAVAPGSVGAEAVAAECLTINHLVPSVVSSIAGVSHDGGDVALIAGANIAITPNDAAHSITIAATSTGGDVTDVFAGPGLVAENPAGPQVTLAVATGAGLETTEEDVQLAADFLSGAAYDSRFVNAGEADAITTGMLLPDVVSGLNGVRHDGGQINLIAGENITIAPDDAANTITISAAGSSGGIARVSGGAGLVATDPEGPEVTLSIGAGPGIAVSSNTVAVDPGAGLTVGGAGLALLPEYLDGSAFDDRFLASDAADWVTTEMIAPAIVSSIAGVTHDGGDIDLIGGANILVSPSDGMHAVTIAATDVVTDISAGPGIAVVDPSGPAPTVSVVVGDGLELIEDGIIVDPAAIAGGGLRRDGENNLAVDPGTGLEIDGDGEIALEPDYIDGSTYDARFVNEEQVDSVTEAMIQPDVIGSVSGVGNDCGNIDLVAGTNVTIVPDDEEDTITISALGDVTSVAGGAGLTATSPEGPEVSLAVNAGTGLEISEDAVRLTSGYSSGSSYDGRFVNESQAAGGDASGTFSNLTIDGLQGRPVSTETPETNEVLTWSGSTWRPAGGSGLSGSGSSNYVARFNGTSSLTTSSLYESGGNIGVGTTGIDARLEVDGDIDASGDIRLEGTKAYYSWAGTPHGGEAAEVTFGSGGTILENTSGEGAGVYFDGDYAALWSAGDNDIIKFCDEDAMEGGELGVRARIDGSGGFHTVSDATLKRNIVPMTGALEKLQTLTGYSFEYRLNADEVAKGDEPRRSAGLLAQELQAVLPEAVSSSDGHLFVNYDALIPLLLEAIKEQQGQVEALVAANDELERTLAALAARVAALEPGD